MTNTTHMADNVVTEKTLTLEKVPAITTPVAKGKPTTRTAAMPQKKLRTKSPIKTYGVFKTSTFSHKYQEIHHNGKPFIFVDLKTRWFKAPILRLHTHSYQGPIVAGATFPTFGSCVEIVMKDPETTDSKERVSVARDPSWTISSFSFPDVSTGQLYRWQRTRNPDLGAGWMSSNHYKLLSHSDADKVLAVYIKEGMFGEGEARINFMVELGDEFELQALTAIMAIQTKLRRDSNNSAASAGAGGGGGGC